MGRKLLAMDVDGTAVCDDYSMGEKSKEALRAAREAGHVTAFVTGRRDVDMLSMGPDQWCVDYQILNTGGKVIRCRDRKVFCNTLIPPHACEKLIRHCLDHHLQLQVCHGMVWQVTQLTESTRIYAQQLPEVYYINSEPGCIDIMATGVTKWNGILWLADHLGIRHEDIITVGNYYNDIDMIQAAAVGIAVANSLDPVKEAADFVTENDNNHDAVAEIIENMMRGAYDLPARKDGKEGEKS